MMFEFNEKVQQLSFSLLFFFMSEHMFKCNYATLFCLSYVFIMPLCSETNTCSICVKSQISLRVYLHGRLLRIFKNVPYVFQCFLKICNHISHKTYDRILLFGPQSQTR